MGDKEFEAFLNNDDDDNEEIPECQKRLLFDIIQTKMGNSTDLVVAVSELYAKDPNPAYKAWLKELEGISKQSFEQLDYLMTVIMDELDSPSKPPDTI